MDPSRKKLCLMKDFRFNPFKCFCTNPKTPSGHERVASIRPGGVGGAAGTSSGDAAAKQAKRRSPQSAHTTLLGASGNYADNDVPQKPREQARVASVRSSGGAAGHTGEHSNDPPKESLTRLAVAAGGGTNGGNIPGVGWRCHIEEHYRDGGGAKIGDGDGKDADREYVLYHIAIAESLRYKDLPELVDPEFQGFELDDHDYVAGGAAVEAGQSSKEPQHVPDAYCDICMEDKYSFECMDMKGCAHAYCASCVSQYVKAKVEANEALIACPNTECLTGLIEPDMCRFIISPEIFDRWGTRLCEEGIAVPTKLYCPFKDCSIMVINEGQVDGSPILDSVCPHCRRRFCAKCKVPWHSEFTCEQYQKMKDREPSSREDKLLVKMANQKKWQRCPRCGFIVERTLGCNYIKCRCGHTFCYRCAGPSSKINHACANGSCRVLMNQKSLIILESPMI